MSSTSQDVKNLARTAGQTVGIAAQALDDLLGNLFPTAQERAGKQQLEEQRMSVARSVAGFKEKLRAAKEAEGAAEEAFNADRATFTRHESNAQARADGSNPEARVLNEASLNALANSMAGNKASLDKAKAQVTSYEQLLGLANKRLLEVQAELQSFDSAVQAGRDAEEEAKMRLESARLAEGLQAGTGAGRAVARTQERADKARREAEAAKIVADVSAPQVDADLAALRAEAGGAPQTAAERMKAMMG